MHAWRVDVLVRPEHPDPAGEAAKRALAAAGVNGIVDVRSKRGFLLGADLAEAQVRSFANAVLCDPVLDQFVVHAPTAADPQPKPGTHTLVVRPRAGVTDPVAHSVQKALGDMRLPAAATGTYRAFEIVGNVDGAQLVAAARRALANDVVNEVLLDRLPPGLPSGAGDADLGVHPIPLAHLTREGLEKLSQQGGLALDGEEMLAIQAHFAALGRAPTRME
ncbi:MAG: phosphoribosylformylglycinamidine synthase, partial [Planctomycetota bacterium]